MYSFNDYDTGEPVSFSSVDELILSTAKDYLAGEISAYFAEIEGVQYRVSEGYDYHN